MTRSVKVALGLWVVLALVVFNVTFDWQTRMAGHGFVRSQHERRAQGLPTLSIEDGFRPMVGAAARQSAVWLVVILGAGSAMIAMAARGRRAP